MKKPKKRRLPKKPKAGNIETLKRYLAKVKEVNKHNKKLDLEYKKYLKLKSKINQM